MSALEIVAFLLGIANVSLVVRRSIWNYPFGLAMVALYARIFLDARLYSDAILQVFFVVVQIYGWWNWSRNRAQAGAITVGRLTRRERAWWAIGCLIASAIWGYGMNRFTDAAFPWADAAIAITSVAAQILMSRRAIENWWLWIAVDIGSIALYAAKGLWLTMVLYGIFLALAVWGLIDWQRVARRQAVAV
ncbi:nicotinamide riboside transporter PnuC [Sphingomonas sp. MMS24-J45]|uniref:nicotinamide riboside transporter PnuC n=1 Tax=Sphingomonas sp. MMS24-J45 TaxID=3238806 RepID=UPI00384DF747